MVTEKADVDETLLNEAVIEGGMMALEVFIALRSWTRHPFDNIVVNGGIRKDAGVLEDNTEASQVDDDQIKDECAPQSIEGDAEFCQASDGPTEDEAL